MIGAKAAQSGHMTHDERKAGTLIVVGLAIAFAAGAVLTAAGCGEVTGPGESDAGADGTGGAAGDGGRGGAGGAAGGRGGAAGDVGQGGAAAGSSGSSGTTGTGGTGGDVCACIPTCGASPSSAGCVACTRPDGGAAVCACGPQGYQSCCCWEHPECPTKVICP
jgi:hypothetical protein